MGQLRLQLSFIPGIGFYIGIANNEIAIVIPFICCYVCLHKSARGYDLFNKWRKY